LFHKKIKIHFLIGADRRESCIALVKPLQKQGLNKAA